MERRRVGSIVCVIAACLVITLGGQALADSLLPEIDGADTGQAVGRAALSYASGLRTYLAAVLWSRTDPLLHNYYAEVPLEDQRYILSTVAAVQALDPKLDQSYYVGSWVLVQNDRIAEGLEMARRGVRENSDSGLLITNLAQILMLYSDDRPGAYDMAKRALGPDVVWADAAEQANAYATLGAIFRRVGRADLDAFVQSEIDRLEQESGGQLPAELHDHDNDGTPDH